MKEKLCLKSLRLENFKAVQDSKSINFTPLTVLIGNNGSGKSSLVEGLETYRSIVVDGLDKAMQRWYGMSHVWNKSRDQAWEDTKASLKNTIRFGLGGKTATGSFKVGMEIAAGAEMKRILIREEKGTTPEGYRFSRNGMGRCEVTFGNGDPKREKTFYSGESALEGDLYDFVESWQFLSLAPDPMSRPTARNMAVKKHELLARDGSNIAHYLLQIRNADPNAFAGIAEAMEYVLGYARDFEPVETSEIQPTVYLQMLEESRGKKFKVPGWMMSTGTLRILALLAVLRDPYPAPLIIIEEVENGLDPRTIHLIVDEIQNVVQSGRSQVILTTHSPYLLDLLPLSSLLLCERGKNGEPRFTRPADENELAQWSEKFGPGQLYTMSRLSRGVGK